ncbi:hypothetical protein, partial [Vibrio cincinnatiensis]|uniref:hypothetical protein n=1 Tax=Vibrio cincinnatiensis TaxID=675 RepID=UPI001EE154F2
MRLRRLMGVADQIVASRFSSIDLSNIKAFNGRFGTVISYSEREHGETKAEVRERGYTTGGLGFSASATYQYFPEGLKGWGPVVTVSHDEFTDKFVPQIQYWFEPQVRLWVGHVLTSHGENTTQAEFQIDF